MSFNLKKYLKEKCEIIDSQMINFLPEKGKRPESVVNAIHYSMFAGGKRLRPVLALATYEMFKDTPEVIYPAACALEMVHTFSLIHDDLPSMDDDDFRRGKPTNHKVFGEAVAILAGDALSIEAFKVLAYTNNIKAVQLLADSVGVFGVIGGQVVDIESENGVKDAETLDFIHNAKTAALIEASILMGAVYADVDEKTYNTLAEFGRKIGLIFQIVDDILDITSTTEILGKDVGSDEARGKLTYPSIYGLDESDKRAKKLLKESLELLDSIDADTTVLEEIAKFFVERID